MSKKTKATASTGTTIQNVTIQMGPAKTDPPSAEAVIAIANAAGRLADALSWLAERVGGPPITVSGPGILVGKSPED